MDSQTPAQAPVAPANVYVPVRMHHEWWKMALFLIAILVIAQLIAIKIATN